MLEGNRATESLRRAAGDVVNRFTNALVREKKRELLSNSARLVIDNMAKFGFVPHITAPEELDMNDCGRQLLALSMCDAHVRQSVWNMCTERVYPIEPVLANPLAASLGQPGGSGGFVLSPQFWVAFFDIYRLRDYTFDKQARCVVTKRTAATFKPEPERLYTEPFVRFYFDLCHYFAEHYEDTLRKDAVLLFFVATCLLDKNTSLNDQDNLNEVVRASHYVGPMLKTNGLKMQMMKALRELAPKVCAPEGMPDYRVLTRQSLVKASRIDECWGNLAYLLNFGEPRWVSFVKDINTTSTAAAPTTTPGGEDVRFAETTQNDAGETESLQDGDSVAEDSQYETGSSDGEGFASGDESEPATDDESSAAAAGSSGDEAAPAAEEQQPSAADATSAVAAADSEPGPTAADVEAAAATAQEQPTSVSSSLCSFHTYRDPTNHGLCPDACIRTRIGRRPADTTARAKVTALIASSIRSHDHASELAADVVATMARQTPLAARVALASIGVAPGTQLSDKSWAAAVGGMRALNHNVHAAGLASSPVGAMARACGWRDQPVGEQLARYATAYAARDTAHATQLFDQLHWPTENMRALEQFKQRHPVAPLRELQLVSRVTSATI